MKKVFVSKSNEKKIKGELKFYDNVINVLRDSIQNFTRYNSWEEFYNANKKYLRERIINREEEFYKSIKIKQEPDKFEREKFTLLNTNWSMMLLATYCKLKLKSHFLYLYYVGHSQRKIEKGLIEKEGQHFEDEKEKTSRPLYIIKFTKSIKIFHQS